MFAYSDPAGEGLLTSDALTVYRILVDQEYNRGAMISGSKFVTLETMTAGGNVPQKAAVEWPAYPKLHSAHTDGQIDSDRARFHDEYVEWKIDRDATGNVTRITFTTLFPEYYISLGTESEAKLVNAIKKLYPGAVPQTQELYGTSTASLLNTPQKRFDRLQTHMPLNPWNNGEKGIMCLLVGPNSLPALAELVGDCAVPKLGIPVGSVCGVSSCVPGRNSDPRVCKDTQSVVRSGKVVSLADPAGIEFERLDGVWEKGGAVISIQATPSVWKVSQNGHRAELNVTSDLTLDGDPITSGTQVSRSLFVKATVATLDEGQLVVAADRGTPTSSRR